MVQIFAKKPVSLLVTLCEDIVIDSQDLLTFRFYILRGKKCDI
jgi:hypothetical protein